jgi:hypothetical protein
LKNIEGKSIYSHTLSPSSSSPLKIIEGKSIYSHTLSHTLSLLSLPPLSLPSLLLPLPLSLKRRYTKEAYRGSTQREGKHTEEVYRGKGSRIVTVVIKQGSIN